MDVSVNILGAGPSLKCYDFDDNTPCIFTNSLIRHPSFLERSDSIFVAHEPRIFTNEFLKQFLKITDEKCVFIGGKLSNLMKKENLKFIDIEDILLTNDLSKEIYEETKCIDEFLKNVVLDYAVPLSIALGFKKITLFGCDFNYGKNNKPEYFVNNLGNYEHTFQSAKKWSLRSLDRFYDLQCNLKKHEVELCRVLSVSQKN